MSLIINGTTVKGVKFNGTTVNTVIYNGETVFTSEEYFTPSWTISGTGWTNTTWGTWGVGRDQGNLLIGIATTTFNTNGHSKLRFTPNSHGWDTGRARGAIRIYVNDTLKYSLGAEDGRSDPLEIDISSYSGDITVKVELQADWGYTTMYCDTQLLLHD